jgi:hypothetical protein
LGCVNRGNTVLRRRVAAASIGSYCRLFETSGEYAPT